jgi:aspartate kinase
VARSLSVLADLSPAVQDRLLSTGELLSTHILCDVLRQAGVPTEWVDARDLIVTDGQHGQAEPLLNKTAARCRERISPVLERGQVPVTQGYIGRSESGAVTTLGRGGSDYTASLLGAALAAEEIEIWTDVDGIMTADPSLVPQALSIPVMSFQEASELAFFGARVLHPNTLRPAVKKNIPVRVLNTRRPENPGSTILADAPVTGAQVKSIAYKESVTLVNLVSARMFKAHGFMKRLFETLDSRGISPDGMAASEVSVALALHDPTGLDSLVQELEAFGAVSVRRSQAIVCVVGERLKESPGIVSQIFEDLKDVRVSLVSHGGSAINLGFVVDEADLARVVRRLHARFFERPRAGTSDWNDALFGPPALL